MEHAPLRPVPFRPAGPIDPGLASARKEHHARVLLALAAIGLTIAGILGAEL